MVRLNFFAIGFTVCIRRVPGERGWIGIADADTVAEVALDRMSR